MSIGMPPMYYALQTLNNPEANDMAKRLALGVYIITIPEACRFPRWKRHLVNLLRQFETMILIQDVNRFDKYFPTGLLSARGCVKDRRDSLRELDLRRTSS